MPLTLPKFFSRPYLCAGGVAAFIAALYICRLYAFHGVEATVCAVLAYSGTIILLEMALGVPADAANGLNFARRDFSAERSFYKLVGLGGSFGCVGSLYWLFPEYHYNFWRVENGSGFYNAYSDALLMVWPVVAMVAVPYIVCVDAVMREPKDGYYWLGRWMLHKPGMMKWRGVAQHCLGWIVRAYFLALVFVYADENFNALIDLKLTMDNGMISLYQGVLAFVVTLGFVLTVGSNALPLRLMGTHIRSTDPTLYAWWLCFLCFQPFKSLLDRYVWFPEGTPWLRAVEHAPALGALWAFMLIILLILGLVADVTLGNRYGQLTHRGIVTQGMYRYSKHPSYILGMLALLVAYMPPLLFPAGVMVWHGFFAIGCTWLIYFLRARTEERHLSNDPAYVAYALWINEHGVLRKLGVWFPKLKYMPPQDAAVGDTAYKGLALA